MKSNSESFIYGNLIKEITYEWFYALFIKFVQLICKYVTLNFEFLIEK